MGRTVHFVEVLGIFSPPFYGCKEFSTKKKNTCIWHAGGLPHLISDVLEEVCARLPLVHMARAALVCRSWASTYASCLAFRQNQLKDLAPASAISAVVANLNPNASSDFTNAFARWGPLGWWDLEESVHFRFKEDSLAAHQDEGSSYQAFACATGVFTT